MASYKKLYEDEKARADALQVQIDQMTNLDGMVGELTEVDDREFLESFIDRCKNRAEMNLLIRVLNRLGA